MDNPISTIETNALTGLLGVIAGYWLKIARQKWEDTKIRGQRLEALRAEIDYCARLAKTYLAEHYGAPLYRFPKTVFETTYPHLISQTLSESDILALTGFYSQVDQMNRGLNAAEGYRAANDENRMNEEIGRLRLKAQQMAHTEPMRERGQMTDFYSGAIAAINRHIKTTKGILSVASWRLR